MERVDLVCEKITNLVLSMDCYKLSTVSLNRKHSATGPFSQPGLRDVQGLFLIEGISMTGVRKWLRAITAE